MTHVEAGRAAYDSLLVKARLDVNVFCEFVLRSDKRTADADAEMFKRIDVMTGISGDPIKQHSIHEEMHRALDAHRDVVVMGFPESGKSVQVGQGRVLHELGKHPEDHFVLIGNTQAGAKKTLGPIKKYIERSDELKAVFPRLRPGSLWTTESITVERSTASRDPSVQTVGLHGDIQGARYNGCVIDDLLDYENTRTDQLREDTYEWLVNGVLARRAYKAWTAFLTNAWHERDCAHRLAADGWKMLRFPVEDEMGRPTLPDLWPPDRIAEARKTFKGPRFPRLFMCVPRDETTRTFVTEAIEWCCDLGKGYSLVERFDDELLDRTDCLVVTGVDVGATRKLRGASTVLFTLFFHPNGMRQPLMVRVGNKLDARGSHSRWLLTQIADLHDRYGGVFVVESNATQKYIVEMAQEAGAEIDARIVPFETGNNKHDPVTGLESMAAEFEHGRWIIPEDERLRPWLTDMDTYDPEAHTGDYLMAAWMSRTYGQRVLRKRRRLEAGEGGVGVRTVGTRRDAQARQSAMEEALRRRATEADDPVERALCTVELGRIERARAGAVTLEDLTGT